MFLIYGIFYVLAVAIGSILARLICAIVIVTYQELTKSDPTAKMDKNSDEYLSRYMPKS